MNKNQKKIVKFLSVVVLSTSISMGIILDNSDQVISRQLLKPNFMKGSYQELLFFTSIPEQPVTANPILSYDSVEHDYMIGIIPENTQINIEAIYYDSDLNPVFLLEDGSYIEALKSSIYDNKIYAISAVEDEYWIDGEFSIYTEPRLKDTKMQNHSLKESEKVNVESVASTHFGQFYKIKGSGWIESKYLTKEDKRMEYLQKQLTDKYGDNNNISIYVKRVKTGEIASIHEDKKMYSASVSKLPILYYTQQQVDNGTIKMTDEFKNTDEVNKFKGSYDPDGSGNISKIPDNEKYTVETLLEAVSKNSDNVASNILGYYVAHQFDKDYYNVINEITTDVWNMDDKEVSVKTAAEVMEAIYEQEGQILDYLSETYYDNERISKNISERVAHKIGDAYDFKHDVAIVYTESPFVLSIFTNQSSYDEISNIADLVYGILK